jgi:hypothetical protein
MLKLKKKKIDVEAFIADSFKGLQLVTTEHRKKWRLGQEKAWAVDENSGKVRFTFADGAIVSAPAQVVGIYRIAQKIFTWAWNHPNVPLNLQHHAQRVREFGVKYGSTELTTQTLPCTEKRAWEFAALAVMLAEADGAYCLQTAPDTFVFVTFGEVDLKHGNSHGTGAPDASRAMKSKPRQ